MRLSKKDVKRLTDIQQTLADGEAAIRRSFEALMVDIAQRVAALNAEVEAYNARVSAARVVIDDVSETLRAAFDDKSDRWRESDAGQEAEALVDAFEGAYLEYAEPVCIVDPDTCEPKASSTIADLLRDW